MRWESRCGTLCMKRSHVASAATPNSPAPAALIASIASGLENRMPTAAPTHNPAKEAPQPRTGVRSQPTTTSR